MEILRQFIRYSLAGLLSGGVDLGLYAGLYHLLGVNPLAANLVSRTAGGLVCYFVNRYWTFGDRGTARSSVQFVRFWLVFLASLFLSEILLAAFYEGLEWPAVPAKLAAEGIILVFNFLALRHYTFR